MRIGIIGGGLAGSMLAWRLARSAPGWRVDLVTGGHCRSDATAASGGAVRAFETNAQQRQLAIASLTELLASPTLRRWAQFRPIESIYLRQTESQSGSQLGSQPESQLESRSGSGLADAVAEVDAALPGSARLIGAAELDRLGWAGVAPDAVAVFERQAGFTAPSSLREAVLAEPAVRRRVRVLDANVASVTLTAAQGVRCAIAGGEHEYDLVVVAAGAWTPALLRASGLPADGFRTKSIQYAIHPIQVPADGWHPTQFVDEETGLYGRPTQDGGLLLGLPTELWDVDPARPPITPQLLDTAAERARARFPKLQIAPAARLVGSTDSYHAVPTLSLRPVIDRDQRLLTFAGGAGGSVKTVLAASHHAAVTLVDLALPPG